MISTIWYFYSKSYNMLEITLVFFWNYVILTFWNNMVAEYNKSFLIKLQREIHTFNSVDSININENKTDHIF